MPDPTPTDETPSVHVNTRDCEPMTPETAAALGRVFKAVHEQLSGPTDADREKAREATEKWPGSRYRHLHTPKESYSLGFLAGLAAGRADGMEAAAKIAETYKGGFTANVRTSEDEPELIRDPDGPWALNSDIAAAIRGRTAP